MWNNNLAESERRALQWNYISSSCILAYFMYSANVTVPDKSSSATLKKSARSMSEIPSSWLDR